MEPIRRTSFRIALGRIYFTYKRYFEWAFGSIRFTKYRQDERLLFQVFQHQTPLLRQLKEVDMWLQYNKIKNLSIAIKLLNGLVIQPGETFSYWKQIGKPSKRKGYVDGMVLFYGKYKHGIGGGLCQLSNLIYWMTLHTPLNVTERHRHSYDVFPDANRTQPFGSGATCAYNYLDLRIYNPTRYPYQLIVYLTDDQLVGEWRSTVEPITRYEVYEKEHKITQEYWGGYVRHNIISRKVYNFQNRMIDDEYITENHAIMMYPPFLHASQEEMIIHEERKCKTNSST